MFIHKFDSITTIGLLLTLVLIFMGQSEVILENPLHIILIAVPLILQTFLIFFIAYGACKLLKLPHDISAPAGMIGASNFFELSVAVAVALFGTTSAATCNNGRRTDGGASYADAGENCKQNKAIFQITQCYPIR